jgi:hypothetical protein
MLELAIGVAVPLVICPEVTVEEPRPGGSAILSNVSVDDLSLNGMFGLLCIHRRSADA